MAGIRLNPKIGRPPTPSFAKSGKGRGVLRNTTVPGTWVPGYPGTRVPGYPGTGEFENSRISGNLIIRTDPAFELAVAVPKNLLCYQGTRVPWYPGTVCEDDLRISLRMM